LEGRFVHTVLGHRIRFEQAGLLGEGATAPDAIDRTAASRRDEPCARIRRRAFARPAFRCGGEGLLRGFLGKVEVAEEADERSEDTAPLVAEDPLEDG
jgi:hypothetical protein